MNTNTDDGNRTISLEKTVVRMFVRRNREGYPSVESKSRNTPSNSRYGR
jgi:hypothetical protein